MILRTGLSLWLFLVPAMTSLAAPAAADSAAEISARLSGGDRPAADRVRDAGRKPAEVVAFLGVEPGMTVVDLIAAGGYYTEVLALAVGAGGKVYAQNTKFALEYREGANDKAMTTRLADGRLPNVERLDREIADLGLAPNSIDAAITALNFHDIYNGGGPAAADGFLKAVYAFLEPGGSFGIIDHAGGVGDDDALHRIEEQRVIDAAKRAGFELAGVSEVLRNPADDRTLNVFDTSIRGHTDRFVLRLRKPDAAGGGS
jgi:predicted methyltransferase